MGSINRFRVPSTSILSIGIVGILAAWAYAGYRQKMRFEGTENYAIGFQPKIPGWKALPKTPESLFVFENSKKHFILRGSVSQVIAEVNPTPDLNTDSMAQFYIDRTHENMPAWTAKRLPDMSGANTRFSVIDRQNKDHSVITAFTVKGNTTLMVSISAQKSDHKEIDDAMFDLKDYLKSVSLSQEDMGGGKKALPGYSQQAQ